MPKKILFIGHDANHAGAQYLLLHLLNYVKTVDKIETLLLLGGGGGLEEDFRKASKVIFWPTHQAQQNSNKYLDKIKQYSIFESNSSKKEVAQGTIFDQIEAFAPDIIFSNTIANGYILQELEYLNCPFLLYCHELEKSILTHSTPEIMDFQLNNAAYILVGSRAVKENLIENHNILTLKIAVYNSYIDCKAMKAEYDDVDKMAVRNELGISANATVIGGCGLIEWRKGIDVFLSTAQNLLKNSNQEVHFIWVGVDKNTTEFFNLAYDLERMGIEKNVHFIQASTDIIRYTACFDLFFMSSREDPYPLVMIEAGLNKTPTICFEKSGGAVDFVGEQKELIIPYLDIQSAAKVFNELIENKQNTAELGEIFYKKAWQHDISVQGPKILKEILNFVKKRPKKASASKLNPIEESRLQQYVRVLSV